MSSRKRHHESETEWSADRWYKELFCKMGVGAESGAQYADAFANHGIRWETLKFLESEHLQQMGITKIGHSIEIMNYIRRMSQESPRSRPVKTSSSSEKNSSPPKRSKNEPRSEVCKLDSRDKEVRTETRKVRAEPVEYRVGLRDQDQPTVLTRGSSSSPIEIDDSPPTQSRISLNGNGVVSSLSERTLPATSTKIRYPIASGPESVFSRLGDRRGESPIKISFTQSPKSLVKASTTKSVLRSAIGSQRISVDTHASRQHICQLSPRPKTIPTVRLENPFVTRVGPSVSPKLSPPRSRSPKREKDYMFGSMTADQVELEQELRDDKGIKQRLGFRSQKGGPKRVTFDSPQVKRDRGVSTYFNNKRHSINMLQSAVCATSGRLSVPLVDANPYYS